MLLLSLLLVGCQTRRVVIPVKPQDNTARLAKHPEFAAAAKAGPRFVLDCFDTITRLEDQLAAKGP